MSYVTDCLSDEEMLVGQADWHWTWYATASLPLVGAGVVALASHLWLGAGSWVILAMLAIGVALFARSFVPLIETEIAVTNQRLIYKRGWFHRTVEELGLRAIEETNLQQGFVGRLLGFGEIVALGTGRGEIKLPPIAKPAAFRERIEEARQLALSDDG